MANKRKNKKKNAAAKQKAAAAYMSKKNAPVAKAQTQKPASAPKPQAKPEPARAPEKANPAKAQPQGKAVSPKAQQPKPQEKSASAKPQPAGNRAKKPTASAKPARSGKPRSKSKKKEPLRLKDLRMDRVIGVFLVFCVLVAGLTTLIFWLSTRFTVPKDAIFEYRANCPAYELYEIQVDAAEQSRLASEMKRKGDVKLFEYYAADELIIPDKGQTGWLNLSNAFNNKYVLMASIVDEAGNVRAHTRGIPAGYTYGEIALDWSVPYGRHDMHLVVCAYDIKTHELVGVQYSNLTVQVGIEEEMTDA